MKKFMFLFVFVFVLAACVPQPTSLQTSMATPIPDALKVVINGLLLVGVTYGLQLLFDLVKIDLRGLGVAVAVAISEVVILQLQGVINLIPAQYDTVVTLGFEIALSLLTFLGSIRLFAQKERASQLLARGSIRG
jgi:hypothetical protein